MSTGYSRQPRSESRSPDYKFRVLFSTVNDRGSHTEHFVEEFTNTSSVKIFRKSLLLSGSLVWGWRSEKKWHLHGDHFTKVHNQLPKDKREATSKKHPHFPSSLPQTPLRPSRASHPKSLSTPLSLAAPSLCLVL